MQPEGLTGLPLREVQGIPDHDLRLPCQGPPDIVVHGVVQEVPEVIEVLAGLLQDPPEAIEVLADLLQGPPVV